MRDLQTNKTNSKGQALVEMALVLLLLLLLVLGIFEFGRAMYIKNTLTHSARAGARAAVVTAGITSTGSPVTPDASCNYPTTTGNDVIYKAVCTSLYSGIKKSDTRIEVSVDQTIAAPTTELNSGDMVTVKVSLVNFTSVVPNFIPVPTTLSGDTAMRYE